MRVRSWAVFDWNDLRYLIAVAEKGTLVAAARELGVKHTTVARRLGALETDLGVKVVRKAGERYAVTEAGAEVLAVANEIKEKADAIERRVVRTSGSIAGVVRVTMPETISGYFVRQLSTLRARHPDLVLNVIADLRVFDLARGEADIAVRMNEGGGEGDLVERKLGVGAWSLYASRAYVAARGKPELRDLASHDVIGFEGAIDRSPGAVWLREQLPSGRYAMRCNGIHALLDAAVIGAGVAALPCFLGDAESELVCLLPEPFVSRPIRMVVPADLARVPRVRAVMDFIVELFQRDGALFRGVPLRAAR